MLATLGENRFLPVPSSSENPSLKAVLSIEYLTQEALEQLSNTQIIIAKQSIANRRKR